MWQVKWLILQTFFKHFWTSLKPGPGGLDPSPIYHWKAHKLLYRHHISDLPDAHLTCLRSVTYRKQTCNLIIISPSPQFHLYPNCNSTQVCKMGRTPFQMFQLLYGQYFLDFFKIGWILDTKIVFSPISQFFAISHLRPSRKTNCVMLRLRPAHRKMNC